MAVDVLAKVEVLREELDLFRQVSRSIDNRDILKAAVTRLRRALTQVEAFAGGVCDWLGLHRMALSSATPHRVVPAHLPLLLRGLLDVTRPIVYAAAQPVVTGV